VPCVRYSYQSPFLPYGRALRRRSGVNVMRRTIVTLLVASLLILTGCSERAPDSALDRLLIVFQGEHSKKQIQSKLDQAFRLYDVPITEENYTRYGSILVSLRRDAGNGVTEMEILDHSISTYTPEVKLEEMLPISSLILQSEGQGRPRY
jgi:hypothetical protein